MAGRTVRIIIDKNRCKGCLLCASFCPKGLIVLDKDLNSLGLKPAIFKGAGQCSGCSMCAVVCPDCCIEISK